MAVDNVCVYMARRETVTDLGVVKKSFVEATHADSLQETICGTHDDLARETRPWQCFAGREDNECQREKQRDDKSERAQENEERE